MVVAAVKPIPPIPLMQKSKAPFIKQTKSQNFATQISHMLPDLGAPSLWSPTVSTTSSHTSPLTANQQALICGRHYYKPNQSVNECCENSGESLGSSPNFKVATTVQSGSNGIFVGSEILVKDLVTWITMIEVFGTHGLFFWSPETFWSNAGGKE